MLLSRRRLPLPVLLATLAAYVLATLAAPTGVPALLPAAMIAAYTATRHRDGARTYALVAVVIIVASAASAAIEADRTAEPLLPELQAEVGFLTIPAALGFGLRQRSERLDQMIEHEATARIQAERLRIARDLHDVVAHSVSTMTVQAGVAAHLLESKPQHAKGALEAIAETGKMSLEELRTMVGVLRSTDEPLDAPLAPAPADANDLEPLLDRAAKTGLKITTHVHGSFPADTAAATVVAAHRIIGESLANAARHAGPVPARVSMVHSSGAVAIQVENAAGPGGGGPPSTGVGIKGMTERAEALGGTLAAGPTPQGGFQVDASLPYRRIRS